MCEDSFEDKRLKKAYDFDFCSNIELIISARSVLCFRHSKSVYLNDVTERLFRFHYPKAILYLR
jgi:hypothetical protein